jgi:hypothetical protein
MAPPFPGPIVAAIVERCGNLVEHWKSWYSSIASGHLSTV